MPIDPPLPLVERDQLSDGLLKVWDFLARHGAVQHVMRALFNNQEIASAYFGVVMAILKDSGLSPQERELLILAVARAENCPYVWNQHVRIGRNIGLTDQEMRTAVATRTRIPDDWLPDQTAPDRNARVTAVVVATEFYRMTCRIVQTLGVEMEEPFVGWDLERGARATAGM